jgi:hypothetical protein
MHQGIRKIITSGMSASVLVGFGNVAAMMPPVLYLRGRYNVWMSKVLLVQAVQEEGEVVEVVAGVVEGVVAADLLHRQHLCRSIPHQSLSAIVQHFRGHRPMLPPAVEIIFQPAIRRLDR